MFVPFYKGKAGLLKITYNFTTSLHFKGTSKDLLITHCYALANAGLRLSPGLSDSYGVSLASKHHSLVLLSFLPRLQGSC